MIGTVLSDRYEITGELGRGGMGVVYAARDPLLRRDVAVKMISPRLLDAESEETIQREAHLVAKLDHPAIVPIHDLGRHEGGLYLVMPLVRGETLRTELARGTLRLGEIVEIGVQAAQALGYSHARGVVHRDIKPGNMILSRQGATLRLRILDFGLARPVGAAPDRQGGDVPGTIAYLAPEQVEAPERPCDGRADLYALGAVLYECLAGAPPFVGSVYQTLYRVVHEAPRGLVEQGVAIDEELELIVLACLEKDPARRPEDGKSLARDLARYRDRLAESQWARPVSIAATSSLGGAPASPIALGALAGSPLVGRAEEVARLRARLDRALAGECQLVVLGGEAGTGKSRLLQEIEVLARARRVRVLQGRFSDWETAFPYQGLCELVQDFFRAPASSSGLPAVPEIDLDDLAPDLVALYPALSEIPELREALDAEPVFGRVERGTRDPTRVFELLARTLRRLADGRPLVILLENLHAAEIALDALQYLVRRLASTPTFVLATYRSSEVFRGHAVERFLAAFAEDRWVLHVELDPLDREGVRAFTETLVGSSNLSSEMIDRLFEVTEGNPLFCQELVRSLLETGAIQRGESDLWSLRDDRLLDAGSLPATLQQAEERRLERLDREAVRVLSMASILGRRFDYADLAALHGDEDELEPVLDDLVAQGLLREERRRRGDRLVFSSGILRDLLYQELSRRRRRSLHARWARRLETRHAGRLERVYPQLVDHFRAADLADETVRYGLLLARRALEQYSPDDAIRAAKTALDFVEDEGVEDAKEREAELVELLARGHQALGRDERALRHAERAARLWADLGDAGDRVAAAILLAAEVAWRGRRIDEVRRFVDRGLGVARAEGDPEVLRRLLELGATVANLRGERGEARFLDELRRLEARDAPTAAPPTRGGRLVSALALPVSSIDPGRIETLEEWEAAANVFETLLVAGEDGVVVGGLAERWWVDGREVSVVLREDLRFSDETPLDAAAVVASFERLARLRARALPPAFAALDGVDAHLAGESRTISGLSTTGSRNLVFRLRQPLPIFPALLSDLRTAVARPTDAPGLVGSGPFRLAAHEATRVVLKRNPHHRDGGALVDELELRVFDDAWALAAALQAGEVDLVRDLLPDDLEELLRRPELRGGLVEAVKKNVYFVGWNRNGPVARSSALRRAMAGVLRPRDLVWRTLGRFAVPAVCLVPPGVPGHDAGRRGRELSPEAAKELLASADLDTPIVLRAAVHPLFHDRYARLLDALREAWREIGVELDVARRDMSEYLAFWDDPDLGREIDLLIGRWNAAYEDPDNFTWGLFNSRTGLLRWLGSSAESDLLLEHARSVSKLEERRSLYRRFEDHLDAEGAFLPLFHEVDYRLVAPGWRGVELRAAPPYVTYAKISEATGAGEDEAVRRRPRGGGTLRVSTPLVLDTLDPAEANLVDHHEMVAQVFEPLARVDERARILPWLAESFEALLGNRAYRFRLRRDVRFHDGRRLSARDVRWSFERLLRHGSELGFLLLPIRGARAVTEGRAEALAGFKILSSLEFVVELHRPLGFFPALLTHPGTAIVPEEQDQFAGPWSEGCCGTGPFRIVDFEPGASTRLERHPLYWRADHPKAEGLHFRRSPDPEATLASFRAGDLSLAGDLLPEAVESLRRSADFAGDYQESPSLSTYYLALAARGGPLADERRRRAVAECLDLDAAVESVGRLGIRAHGLVPPGLLGYEASRRRREPGTSDHDLFRDLRLRLAVHPVYDKLYAACRDRLVESLQRLGIEIEIVSGSIPELSRLGRVGEVDLVLSRWFAAFPDADCFAAGLYDPKDGVIVGLGASPEMERLIDRGRRETDPALRHAIYRRFEEILAGEHRLLPLFHEQTYRFAGPGVRGLRLGITIPDVRYEELWVEESGGSG